MSQTQEETSGDIASLSEIHLQFGTCTHLIKKSKVLLSWIFNFNA